MKVENIESKIKSMTLDERIAKSKNLKILAVSTPNMGLCTPMS